MAAHAALPDLHQDERLCTCAGCPGDRLRNHVSRLFGVDDGIAVGLCPPRCWSLLGRLRGESLVADHTTPTVVFAEESSLGPTPTPGQAVGGRPGKGGLTGCSTRVAQKSISGTWTEAPARDVTGYPSWLTDATDWQSAHAAFASGGSHSQAKTTATLGFPCGVCKFLLAPIVATLTVAIPIHQGAGQQGSDYFRSAPESVDAARRCGTLWAMVMASTRRANVGSGHRPGRGASRHLRSGPSALDTFAPDACSGCLGCSGREDSLPKLSGHASMV